ncbi:MAG: FHA domain-containing protein [Planctomycetia bacterium]|nr:FHA domain-containing protein [Planctomycetia bacterium]
MGGVVFGPGPGDCFGNGPGVEWARPEVAAGSPWGYVELTEPGVELMGSPWGRSGVNGTWASRGEGWSMVQLAFRILSGSDRGEVFTCQPPVTIGRESGNTLQLNDLLVSRCHLKIQEDNGVVVLADCDSTNGTRVNGEPVRQWILRPGDIVTLGNTTFLVGTRAEIEARIAADLVPPRPGASSGRSALRVWGCGGDGTGGRGGSARAAGEAHEGSGQSDEVFFAEFRNSPNRYREIFQNRVPDFPGTLTPLQMAQVSELFQYLYLKVRNFQEWAVRERMVRMSRRPEEHGRSMTGESRELVPPGSPRSHPESHRKDVANDGSALSAAVAPAAADGLPGILPEGPVSGCIEPRQWQNILDVESLLATCLRKLEQPDGT